jgi:hypothetical protein
MLFPVRNLGAGGFNSDRDGYSLPPNVWTGGVNIRCQAGSVRRSPVFRLAEDATSDHPVFCWGVLSPGATYDEVLYCADGGEMFVWDAVGGTTPVSPGGHVPANSTAPWTGCSLAGLNYLNRPTHVPYYYDDAVPVMVSLVATGWDANWRANAMRSFKDFLIALYITDVATEYPRRVMWSNAAPGEGLPPADWDAADPASLAGYIDLAELTSPLKDGLTLGNSFILYTGREVWAADYVGGTFIFDWRRLFPGGVISQNCVVEAGGAHYVFGPEDIYRHNGFQSESLARNRGVYSSIYEDLRTTTLYGCFVAHQPKLHEIWFCFPSDHPDTADMGHATFANRAAVFNYEEDQWSGFVTLPNCTAATIANVQSGGLTYAAAAAAVPYGAFGGTYAGLGQGLDRHMVMTNVPDAGDGITGDRIYGVVLLDNASLTSAIDDEAYWASYAERVDLPVEQITGPVWGMKLVRGMYPQMTVKEFDVTWKSGHRQSFNENVTWNTAVTLTKGTQYRVDMRSSDRFLSYRLDIPVPGANEYNDFQLFGLDVDIVNLGGR